MEGVEVGKVVSAVDLYCLQETNRHPKPDHDEVVAHEEDSNEEPCSQYCAGRGRGGGHKLKEGRALQPQYVEGNVSSPTVSMG